MAERDLNNEMEALRADVTKLRTDLGNIAQALKEVGKGKAEDARSSVSELASTLREELLRALEGAKDRGKRSVATVEETIEDRPFLTLLTAFGAGILLGKLLDRR